MLEVWTANWFSGINFGIELEKNNWKLLSIDFSEKSHLEARENIKKVNLENTIDLILWNALDEIPKLENHSYDFVFIDWMMRRTKDFLELSWPKIKPWGIIIIDDVIKFKEKMDWFYEYLEDKNIKYNILPIDIDDWVMMIIK
jgi:predicted O-methyltransferase YrrM